MTAVYLLIGVLFATHVAVFVGGLLLGAVLTVQSGPMDAEDARKFYAQGGVR